MTLADIAAPRLLVYGLGNPGRQDDGAGARVIERLEAAGVREGVTLECSYQLSPEDALTVSAYDAVIFVDATIEPGAPAPYTLTRVEPAAAAAMTTHDVSMGSVLQLCARLYGARPAAYVVAIPAHGVAVNAPLTPQTAAHVERVVADLLPLAVHER